VAEWDGVSRPVFAKYFHVGFGAQVSGDAPALSLAVWLTDLTGKLVYSKRAGIDLLAEFSGTQFFVERSTHVLEDEDKAIGPTKAALAGLTENQ
jgi:hypothetical protein